MARFFYVVFGALCLAILSGCSPYVDGYQYMPRPALAQVPPTPPEQVPPVTVQSSVVGIRREDKDAGVPDSVEIRMQVENSGSHTVTFDPASLELVNAELLKFPPALLRPPAPATLAPMQAAMYNVFFPFPPGRSWDNTDLDSLQLRWTVQIDGHAVGQVIYFRRVRYYYYRDDYYGDPYWYRPAGFYGGVVIVHRR